APSLGFKVSAPATLAGRTRDHVQTIGSGADTGALVTYGTGLDGLLVVERPAAHAGTGPTGALGNLPHLSVNGAGGSELVTPLGVIRPTEGRVRLFGRDPLTSGAAALEGVAGFVEAPRFYPYLSGRKNLELLAAYDGGEARSRIPAVLDTVQLADRARDKVGG